MVYNDLGIARFESHDSESPDSRFRIPDSVPLKLGAKKPINRKHINILVTALVGQSSQGRTPTRPRDKRDELAILLWNSTEKVHLNTFFSSEQLPLGY